MKCQEMLTAAGTGTWYLPYEVRLFTVKRELRSRYGDTRNETTRYEFRFRKPESDQWDHRSFDTDSGREEFMRKAFTDLSLQVPAEAIWQSCGHIVDTVVGQRLVAVNFVLNYLQVQFDDHHFNCGVWPVVWTTDGEFRYGQPGYRDGLCSLLARTVTRFEEYLDVGFVFEFSDTEWIGMPLVDPSGEAIEALGYSGPNHIFSFWP